MPALLHVYPPIRSLADLFIQSLPLSTHPPTHPLTYTHSSLPLQRRLSVTLQAAYGEGAWAIMPLTFSLPAQLPAWAEWLEAQAAAGADPGPWILKTTQHLGQGLALLEGEAAYRMARTPRPAAAKPFVVGQRYVTDPLLVQVSGRLLAVSAQRMDGVGGGSCWWVQVTVGYRVLACSPLHRHLYFQQC